MIALVDLGQTVAANKLDLVISDQIVLKFARDKAAEVSKFGPATTIGLIDPVFVPGKVAAASVGSRVIGRVIVPTAFRIGTSGAIGEPQIATTFEIVHVTSGTVTTSGLRVNGGVITTQLKSTILVSTTGTRPPGQP